jgi:hypothetical protein
MRLSLLAPVYSNNNQGQGMAGDLAAQEDKGLCMAIDLQVQERKWEKKPGAYNPEERIQRLCLLPGEPKSGCGPRVGGLGSLCLHALPDVTPRCDASHAPGILAARKFLHSS